MELSKYLRRLTCPKCDWSRVFGPAEMKLELQQRGMQKRDPNPDYELILELFLHHLHSIPCPDCRTRGLLAGVPETDEDADWGDARHCEICREVIPPERLEIFPDSTRCAACKDKPSAPTADDFCPRCGNFLQVGQATGGGVSRYVMRCSACGFRG